MNKKAGMMKNDSLMVKPQYVYKFKRIMTDEDYERVEEIMCHRKMYMPSPFELNDPMEGDSVNIYLDILGMGYAGSAGKIHPIITGIKNEYRIMSLSAIPSSSIMWAHYGCEYRGCCFIFSTEETFQQIKPIIYSDLHFNIYENDIEDIAEKNNMDSSDVLYHVIEESFLYKNKEWSYENEWRLIQRNNKSFLKLKKDEIVGIIIGKNMEEKYKNRIIKKCNKLNLPCFTTYTMEKIGQIIFLPDDMSKNFYTLKEIIEIIYKRNDVNSVLFHELNEHIFSSIYMERI